ncbi:MAG TPA: response regulator transcription factor [Gaiellaceae bacterium]|nr:response regulator transcription factor [Gaiellaceae bacterium]
MSPLTVVSSTGDCGPILVADGDPAFRAFAIDLFERAGFRTAEASSGEAALAAARSERPGLALLDVCLSDLSGFEVSNVLRDEFGDELPIVFVSGERTEPLDRAVGLLVGGDDYVVKPADPDELLARARRLIARSRPRRRSRSRAAGPADLTERELEVLVLLAEGKRPKEIAQELTISPKTVASHLQRVLAKLGVHSRIEAVAVAYREGYVHSVASPPDDPSAGWDANGSAD